MTSNPPSSRKAIEGSRLYDEDIRRLRNRVAAGGNFESRAWRTSRRVRRLHAALSAVLSADGFVSLEVSPTLANDANGTIHEAEADMGRLWDGQRDDQNSGTRAGCRHPHCLAAGINVNVTLLFSIERLPRSWKRYWRAGVTGGAGTFNTGDRIGGRLFVSRVDGKSGPALDRDTGYPLRGKIAIANAV